MIEVVAAVIEYGGNLLVFQRGPAKYDYISNKFEFPGGKIEDGEDQRAALSRELKEELFLDADIKKFITTVEHRYPDFSIRMHCFLVHLEKFEGRLTEHLSFANVSLSEAENLDWVEADRPVLSILRKDYTDVFSS
tara:strand:+ start:177 stop:584 length:408 start_codon:yes stop_codon:yes gene_type:complete